MFSLHKQCHWWVKFGCPQITSSAQNLIVVPAEIMKSWLGGSKDKINSMLTDNYRLFNFTGIFCLGEFL